MNGITCSLGTAKYASKTDTKAMNPPTDAETCNGSVMLGERPSTNSVSHKPNNPKIGEGAPFSLVNTPAQAYCSQKQMLHIFMVFQEKLQWIVVLCKCVIKCCSSTVLDLLTKIEVCVGA